MYEPPKGHPFNRRLSSKGSVLNFNIKRNECESIPNQQTANMEDPIPASFAWTDKQAEGAGKTTTVT
jgi:hypothetical protein